MQLFTSANTLPFQTLSTPSILSKRYGAIPEAEAAEAARRIEDEAFSVTAASASAVDDGIEILQAYSKEISKRMLEIVKSRSGSVSESAPKEVAASTIVKEDVSSDAAAYCVVVVESAGRQIPIAFLERVKEEFNKKHGGGKAATATAKSFNKEFGPKLKAQMQYCVGHPEEINKIVKIKAQVSEVKGVMMENIEKLLGNTKEAVQSYTGTIKRNLADESSLASGVLENETTETSTSGCGEEQLFGSLEMVDMLSSCDLQY